MLTSFSTRAGPRPSVRRVTPMMTVLITAMLLWGARVSLAQAPVDSARTWELRATSGGLIPTGVARSTLKDAQLSAMQVS
jgi:hypothetical protein